MASTHHPSDYLYQRYLDNLAGRSCDDKKETLKVAIFGLGRAGSIHLTNVLRTPRLQLSYLVDSDHNKLSQIKSTHNLSKSSLCLGDTKENIEKIFGDESLSLVIVATPSAAHESLVLAALSGGKHVMCEKPVALTTAAVERCFDVALQKQRVLLCAFNRRYDPAFSALQGAVRRGDVGTLHSLSTVSRDCPKPSLDYLKISGGIFHDCIVHDVDLACWVVGQLPVKVFAVASAFDRDISALGDHDTVVVTLVFPGGVLAHCDISREAVYGYDQRLEALGSSGGLSSHNQRPHQLVASNAQGATQVPIHHSFPSRYSEAYLRQLEHFIALTEGSAKLEITKEHVVGVTKVVEALEESVRTGGMITVQY